MLLSNMCKFDSIATKILTLQGKPVEGLTTSTGAVAQLAEIFLKGTDKGYNPNCDYNFLASVFATLAMVMSSTGHIHEKKERGGGKQGLSMEGSGKNGHEHKKKLQTLFADGHTLVCFGFFFVQPSFLS